MSTKSLYFDIFGRDRSASSTLKGVGHAAGEAGKGFKKAGLGISLGIAAATASVIRFGMDSVRAFAEAEESQNKLAFAYEKFPALADTNISAMRRLNEELAKKTRYDDDAYAVGQAQLAQYGLTGQQIMELTPLLADYAGKTGKDLPTAAEDLGKALLGQGRALKAIGIDFTDTGTLAGNFDAIMAGLRGQVGGFAEQDATTAAGKLDILRNKFGEVQEAVGEKLIDPLSDVMDELTESGAVEDLGKGLASVVQGFSDLEKKTQFFSDFIDDMSQFGNMVDDIEAVFEAFGSGDPDKISDWFGEEFGTGGPLGWWNGMAEQGREFWRGQLEDTTTGMDGIRGGMGGGFSAIGGDMSVFRQGMGAQWGGTWTDANGQTQTGVGNVAASTGAGLLDVLGRVLGFSGQVGPQMGSAWAGADAATVSGWGGIQGSTAAGVGRVGSEVDRISGVVKAPFGDAGSWLAGVGEDIVGTLIGGLRSMIGAAGQAASDVMSAIAGVIPHSPAETGPFSGAGWQAVADGGAALREQFMSGFADMGMDIGAGFDAGLDERSIASSYAAAAPARPQFTIVLESRGGVDLTQYIKASIEGYDSDNVMTSKMGKQR